MPSVIKLLFVIGFSLGLVAPLAYAMQTLTRLRMKTVYPILRVIDREGHVGPFLTSSPKGLDPTVQERSV